MRRTPTEAEPARWHPDRGELDPAVVAGADAVINLAGAGVRGQALERLVPAGPDRQPGAADRDDREGHGRPACRRRARRCCSTPPRSDSTATPATPRWTRIRRPAGASSPSCAKRGRRPPVRRRTPGYGWSKLRTGLILDRGGGLLKPFVLPFRLGIGGPLAGGRQWMPWMSLDGLARRGRLPPGARRHRRTGQPGRTRSGAQRRVHQGPGAGPCTGRRSRRSRRSRSASCSASSPTRRCQPAGTARGAEPDRVRLHTSRSGLGPPGGVAPRTGTDGSALTGHEQDRVNPPASDQANSGFGHTAEQAAAVRPDRYQTLIDYYDAVAPQTRDLLRDVTPKDLDRR